MKIWRWTTIEVRLNDDDLKGQVSSKSKRDRRPSHAQAPRRLRSKISRSINLAGFSPVFLTAQKAELIFLGPERNGPVSFIINWYTIHLSALWSSHSRCSEFGGKMGESAEERRERLRALRAAKELLSTPDDVNAAASATAPDSEPGDREIAGEEPNGGKWASFSTFSVPRSCLPKELVCVAFVLAASDPEMNYLIGPKIPKLSARFCFKLGIFWYIMHPHFTYLFIFKFLDNSVGSMAFWWRLPELSSILDYFVFRTLWPLGFSCIMQTETVDIRIVFWIFWICTVLNLFNSPETEKMVTMKPFVSSWIASKMMKSPRVPQMRYHLTLEPVWMILKTLKKKSESLKKHIFS